jgi:hypothetical protein
MTQQKYPWHRCVPGASFFVPTLDPYRIQREGLQAGFNLFGTKAKITARPGMYRGIMGVLFTLRGRVDS